jgi:hypothetical protein
VAVKTRGYLIARDGQRMLELSDDAPVEAGGVLPPGGQPERIGTVELEGEIVDDQAWRKCEKGVYKYWSLGVQPTRTVRSYVCGRTVDEGEFMVPPADR